ncbi:MAG: hypothetical protein FWB83_08515, partial [Treponema sp.]|nr:hypothetical protein [Treponema sp.]
MKKSFGLLGEKLGHSFSPEIHKHLGGYDYLLYEIKPGDLDAFMKEKRFGGINVTIPYKQAVMPYCASLSDEARTIGSVNTIVKDKDGFLHGYNTDYYGFCVMLESADGAQGGINPKDKKALVLGDGGSAKTVRAALSGLGAREVITISRRGENHYGNIDRHYDAQIIVNTTPVGMYPDNGNCLISFDGFENLTGAADLIYNPMRTKFLLNAERKKIPCVNGLTMLAAQAEMASRLFLNEPERGGSVSLIEKIVSAVISKTRNIALIGMPGCGKSTVGKILAGEMNRPLADIDSLIEAAAGKSIPRIFKEDGEDFFRGLETQALGGETKKSGIVIAAGGGVVTRHENLDLLRQNSVILYLKRGLSGLVTEGRPLSGSVGIETLAKQRLHLYEAWSD